jgi:hypothetical protein
LEGRPLTSPIFLKVIDDWKVGAGVDRAADIMAAIG